MAIVKMLNPSTSNQNAPWSNRIHVGKVPTICSNHFYFTFKQKQIERMKIFILTLETDDKVNIYLIRLQSWTFFKIRPLQYVGME